VGQSQSRLFGGGRGWWRGDLVGNKERRWMGGRESVCVLERNRGDERVGVIPLSSHTH
jgi:hypothetical protein